MLIHANLRFERWNTIFLFIFYNQEPVRYLNSRHRPMAQVETSAPGEDIGSRLKDVFLLGVGTANYHSLIGKLSFSLRRAADNFNKQDGNNASSFYSKHGAMTLDADLCTDERLQKRAARFAGNAQQPGRGGGRLGGGGGHGPHGPTPKKKKLNLSLTLSTAFAVDGDVIDWTSMHIVGTSTTLEKEYLRLTSVSSFLSLVLLWHTSSRRMVSRLGPQVIFPPPLRFLFCLL